MLSTSILSRPRGPRELFTMFAIDNAAMTAIAIHVQFLANGENAHHSGPGCPGQKHGLRRGMRQLLDRVETW